MKEKINYNIGIDIGVGSDGWCVTDSESKIIKKHGKHMWGSRIFNEAQVTKETRNHRSVRRTIERRRERINMLQSLLLDDMEQEFPNFFQRLKESFLQIDDRKLLPNKYNIFSDEKYNDSHYYHKFPSIYHLRNYLINTDEKVDLRLVYLALHHIIKYRGNFLYEGDFSNNIDKIEQSIEAIKEFLVDNYDIYLNISNKDLIEILKEKNVSKANKKDKILLSFSYEKDTKQVLVNVINSILGYSFDINKIFNINIEKSKISFSNEIENEEEIKECLQEYADVYEKMSEIYSWYTLQDILNGRKYISEALIDKFNKYNKDLKTLKKIYRNYFIEEYKDMFRKEGKDNYVAFNGKNVKKCKPDEFYNMLKNKVKKLPDDCEEKEKIISELEDGNFLKKINVTENSAIPHQLHQKELEIILEKQGKYYKTIAENKEKIMDIFTFRIPYYIGPLSKKEEKWSWIVRKGEGKIRPWNFNEIVDEEATAEKFIRRMTNKCTYLINEDVIPKESLLYTRFCVLNELNNIRVNDKHLAKDMKMKIIEDLFKTKKKVTKKMLQEYLKMEGIPDSNITGFSDNNNFNSNMGSYIDMKKIFGKIDESNYQMCEDLIYWITVFEEKDILRRKIKNTYKEITEEQINRITNLKYKGWSRLSKKLLVGLKSNDKESIIEKLENTPLNFMQIINNTKFGFDKQIENLMPKPSKNVKYSDIADIPTSPANKRAIWQTICIVKEITKIMQCEPNNIYIEFARNEEAKVMKDSRAKQLQKKYEEIKYLKDYDEKVYKQLKAHQSDKIISEKLYLYMTQNGKCLYSGKPLDIDNLSLYEVDHITPQCYRKDDSIDNKALVLKEENQRKKDTLLLEDRIIDSRIDWWKSLLDNRLISQIKYYKLIRRKMFETDEDRKKFVQRQLVETRQITKYVTNILKNMYTNTDIYAIRSELTSGFRKEFKIYKNRNVNNYHHAHDAYILNVIGNTLDNKLKYKDEFKYNEYVKNYFKNDKSLKDRQGVISFISKYVDIELVKKTMKYKDCYITRMLEEGTGEFYNQTLYGAKEKPVIPLKSNLKTEKYGGYSNENKAYLTIFKYTSNTGKEEYQLIGIPIKVAYEIKNKKYSEVQYIKDFILKDKKYTDLKIIRNKILINQQYLDKNNEPMRLCSDKEFRADKELILDEKMNRLIYLMNQNEMNLDDKEKEELNDNYEYMFNMLLEKLKQEYKVFENSYKRLEGAYNKFLEIDNNEKKAVINGLIDLMQKGQGNLKAIGLGDREGRMAGKNFDTKKLLTMTFIDKSITGTYERRFKINGVENCSN